jgi:MoaA/NifB/PqqE/SkfB family radical SAM enzyme
MSEATLARLDPLFAAAEEVTFGGYGDPTESPLLVPAVVRAKAHGCSIRLISGGAKLSPRLIGELARSGLDRLVLSMDGARDATLRALRGVPLRAWLKWIRAARAAALRHGRGLRPLVQLNVVAQWGNVEEIPELVDLCAAEGVAGIHAFHLKAYQASTFDRCLLRDPARARPFFDEARRRAARAGVFLQLPPLDPEPVACTQPFEQLFVRHDGQLRGCCSGLFEPADFGLLAGRIGNAPGAAGFAAAWHAPVLQQFRDAVRRGDDSALPAPCQDCAFRRPTLAAHRRPLRPANPALALL